MATPIVNVARRAGHRARGLLGRCPGQLAARRLDRGSLVLGLERAAEFWIGYALPPARAVLAESGWTPDDASGAGADWCARCGASRPVVGGSIASDTGARPGVCPACRNGPALADTVVRLGPYSGPLREWILDIKYRRRWEDMADLLGRRLGEQILAQGVVAPGRAPASAPGRAPTRHPGATVLVVPMPMPWPRRFARGIDHAAVIARGVGWSVGAPVRAVLARTNGPPQVTLSRSRRRRAGGRGIRAARSVLAWSGLARAATVADFDVILVDDVCTTGATIRAATRRLREMGATRVVAAVLAVADDTARQRRAAPAGGEEGHAVAARRHWGGVEDGPDSPI